MRLIDADDLIAHTFKNDISYKAFVNLVKKQQTIEERKTGKWEYSTSSCGSVAFIHRKCSECGYENMGAGTKYCPDCGARMENDHD